MKRFNPVIVLVTILCLSIFVYAQDKKELLRQKNLKNLEDTAFDTVILNTLFALEQIWKVKLNLLPTVHRDDYYAMVLNTVKRNILAKQITAAVSADWRVE